MIQITLDIDNDGARAARREIRKFLEYENAGMSGDRSDRHDEAARGYVVLRRLLEKLTLACEAQDARLEAKPTDARRTVREERGR